jgi:hypothetical protein
MPLNIAGTDALMAFFASSVLAPNSPAIQACHRKKLLQNEFNQIRHD